MAATPFGASLWLANSSHMCPAGAAMGWTTPADELGVTPDATLKSLTGLVDFLTT